MDCIGGSNSGARCVCRRLRPCRESVAIPGNGCTGKIQRVAGRVPHHLDPIRVVEFVDRRPGQRSAPEGEDSYELLTERLEFTVESVTDIHYCEILDVHGRSLKKTKGKIKEP